MRRGGRSELPLLLRARRPRGRGTCNINGSRPRRRVPPLFFFLSMRLLTKRAVPGRAPSPSLPLPPRTSSCSSEDGHVGGPPLPPFPWFEGRYGGERAITTCPTLSCLDLPSPSLPPYTTAKIRSKGARSLCSLNKGSRDPPPPFPPPPLPFSFADAPAGMVAKKRRRDD